MHASALPLASCIMPTADRPAFVPQAIACFLAQDFACRELIVLDNGRTPIAHLLPQADPRVHYQHIGPGYKLGALRNRACELARGEFIVHWDDDDWYAADRITRQVNCLQQTGAELCGSSRIHFLHASAPLAWLYAARGPRPWIAGSTLAYRRTLWERRPFDAVQVGEDSLFVAALPQSQVVDLADPGLCIAAVHAGNTSPKSPMGMEWQPQDAALLRARVLGIAASAPISAPDTAPVAAPAAHAPPEPPAADFLRGRRICIGIHARDAAAGLQPTLQALAARTPAAVQRVVLSDTPGGAACFNRLLREHEADVHVLLECGAQVGPHWLQELLAALDADPRNGLAGPSTNRSWNRQGSLPLARADESGVPAQALALHTQFAGQWQTLTPLHCLADFCYAVKAEVVQAIGAADEAYGAGPCWEMDYSARAARAGFAAVWAQGAYVWRPPVTARRQRDDAANFAASRERYQRKFCGQLLSGARNSIKPHCRGDDCANFAPAQLVELHRPLLTATQPAPMPMPLRAPTQAPAQAPTQAPAQAGQPLVSCIMPTHGRLPWMLQSVRYYQRQDHLRRELIIIDDGPQSAAGQLPADASIHYVHRGSRMSIGAKRNLACELAQGEFVAHWDDDDWYGPSRLAAQLAPLRMGAADITALDATPFMDLTQGRFWRCTPALFARMFVHAVHGGTLVYARRVFEGMARFPDVSLAEDAAFLRSAVLRGARLQAIAAAGHFVYVRHGRNAWRFTCGHEFDAQGWLEMAAPDALAADIPFYGLQGLGSQHAA